MCVGADQANRANQEHQDQDQHNGIFGDALAAFVVPKVSGPNRSLLLPSNC
jgi:hypothetical protein